MDNKRWTQALQRFQPMEPGGPQSAGNPGMGGGNVPYAPGATRFDATNPSVRAGEAGGVPNPNNQLSTPYLDMEQFGGDFGGAEAGFPEGEPMNPERAIQFAQRLMQYFMMRSQQGQRRRG